MKTLRTLLVAVILVFCINLSHAQLKVITNGYVGIGIPTPLEMLHVNGSVRGNLTAGALRVKTQYGYLDLGAQNNSCTHIYTDLDAFMFNKSIWSRVGGFSTYPDYDLTLNVGWDPKLTIQCTTGNVGIGTTSPSYKLHVEGTVGSLGFYNYSDKRLKENIKVFNSGLGKIMELRPVTYNIKKPVKTNSARALPGLANKLGGSVSSENGQSAAMADTSLIRGNEADISMTEFYNQEHVGFLAQDVQKIYPELVHADKKGMLSVDYISMIPILVAAMKEQQEQIDKLTQEVVALKAKAK